MEYARHVRMLTARLVTRSNFALNAMLDFMLHLMVVVEQLYQTAISIHFREQVVLFAQGQMHYHQDLV
jgi:hypothetical protein